MGPLYRLERWEHGWIFAGTPPNRSIPMNALNECLKLFPKGSVMVPSIIHHLRETGHTFAVVCITTPDGLKEWNQAIEDSIRHMPPQERWWKGLGVGSSSAAVFAVFCNLDWKRRAEEMGQGAVPHDADDFGRCQQLMETFPEWKPRIREVAAAYPDKAWPRIVERWDELCAAAPEQQTKILQEIK